MIPNIRIAVCILIVLGTISTKYVVAQENERGQAAVEEIPTPPFRQELLDFVPTKTPDPRIQNPARSPIADRSSARVQRINALLSELQKKARMKEGMRRLPDALPMESPSTTSQEPRFVEPQQPTPPPIVTVPTSIEQEVPDVPLEPTQPQSPISLTKTVDSLSLANSLFAQGKSEMAQSIYEKLLKTPQSSADLVWIQYQLACCYRISGRMKESTQLYRIVGSSKTEPYWASRAHWWLDYLGRAQRLEAQRQKLESQFELFKKAAENVQSK